MKDWTASLYPQQVIHLSPGERPQRTQKQVPWPRLAPWSTPRPLRSMQQSQVLQCGCSVVARPVRIISSLHVVSQLQSGIIFFSLKNGAYSCYPVSVQRVWPTVKKPSPSCLCPFTDSVWRHRLSKHIYFIVTCLAACRGEAFSSRTGRGYKAAPTSASSA